MSNFIFLTNQYMPTPGATGVCVHALAKKLVSLGNSVAVICYLGSNGTSQEVIDGVNVIRIQEPSFMTEYSGTNLFIRYVNRITSVWNKLINLRRYPLRSNALVYRYCKTIDSLLEPNVETTIVATYTPLEAVVALGKTKKKYPSIKAVYYSTDTLSNEQGEAGFLSSNYRMKKGLNWETYLFNICDGILIMECHKDFYLEKFSPNLVSKFRYANFPLLSKPGLQKEVENNDTIVYAGTLHRVLRNPSFAIESLLKFLNSNGKYKVVFLGGGDCGELLADAASKNCNFSYLGLQPHKVAKEMIDNAAILLSIGNSESQMAPSKIYEYMATGKPIIHFYSYEKDPCIEPLQRYGNALIIKEHDLRAIEKIASFLSNVKYLCFESVRGIFENSTPEYTISLMNQIKVK